MKIIIAFLIFQFCGFVHAQNFDKLPKSIQEFMYFERDKMDRLANEELLVADTEKLDPRYSPEGKNIFQVKGFWIERSQFHVFEDQLSPNLKKIYTSTIKGKEYVLLLVHPQSESFYSQFLTKNKKNLNKPDKMYWAAPTASYRSLLLWEEGRESEPFLTKVSADIVIGGAQRTIKGGEIARSVGHSAILQLTNQNSHEIDFFRESFGIIPKGMERGGMLVREMPEGLLTGERRMMPLFSLYSQSSPKEEPYLLTQIKKSGLNPRDYLSEYIFRPFAKQWLDLAIDQGIFMEAHAQNLLVEIDRQGQLTKRFVYRDLGGFNMDLRFRARTGLPLPETLPHMGRVMDDYLQRSHSSEIYGSIQHYFVGGFVYNLDQRMPTWQRDGFVAGPNFRKGNIESLFLKEFKKAYERKTGEKLTIDRLDYSLLTKAIYGARKKLHPSPHRSCVELYGNYGYLLQ